MLPVVIRSELGYPVFTVGMITGAQMCIIPGHLVLGKGALNALTPALDMDQTVSRYSEPNSPTALMGEQPNPWNILQPQVAKSRHRGAKPSRRCELLGKISLLSLE
ncbi:hypothetical protein MA16_Dca006705 [Dendrobium catenatum]|uniref:Uncharacterized protein n=1 Tax=Dendrobium catenatum TaxID=906689 RepID=A0A2I0W8Y0_9ASPA|nr:hypothetical protein MA16_Dca006705 [Dendrobium catenatum]